jgi:hypothetical protein
MADYYPLLSRAVSTLDPNTAETRRGIYERARQAIVKQLRSYDPPLSEAEITRERLSLEEAVRKIESEMREAGAHAPAASAPRIQAPQVHAPGREPARAGAPRPPLRANADAAAQGALAADAEMNGAPEPEASSPEPVRPRINPPRVDAGRRAVPPSGPVYAGEEGESLGATSRPRWPALVAILAVLALAGGAAWVYFARNELSATFGDTPIATTSSDQNVAPKITDRVGQSTDAPAPGTAPVTDTALLPDTEQATETATSTPAVADTVAPDPASLVGQRAILYEETPDQKGGIAFQGSIVWQTEAAPNNPSETVLRGTITVPERNITASLLMQRNTDPTLPASHTIDIQFTLPPDFPNAGISSVPGILLKPSEEAGGSALSGLSVKVTTNFFLIGLSAAPRDVAENLKMIGERSWIDVPLLYDNGRRAVMTLEKGVPGENAFREALAAWQSAAPVAGSQQPGVPTPQ